MEMTLDMVFSYFISQSNYSGVDYMIGMGPTSFDTPHSDLYMYYYMYKL